MGPRKLRVELKARLTELVAYQQPRGQIADIWILPLALGCTMVSALA